MSRDDILSLLEEWDKRSKKRNMSLGDKLLGIVVLSIITASVHALIPSSDHAPLSSLITRLELISQHVRGHDDSIKDHETRIRVLEKDDRLAEK